MNVFPLYSTGALEPRTLEARRTQAHRGPRASLGGSGASVARRWTSSPPRSSGLPQKDAHVGRQQRCLQDGGHPALFRRPALRWSSEPRELAQSLHTQPSLLTDTGACGSWRESQGGGPTALFMHFPG